MFLIDVRRVTPRMDDAGLDIVVVVVVEFVERNKSWLKELIYLIQFRADNSMTNDHTDLTPLRE